VGRTVKSSVSWGFFALDLGERMGKRVIAVLRTCLSEKGRYYARKGEGETKERGIISWLFPGSNLQREYSKG